MADQRLNIIFSGDASQLNQTIQKTEANLNGLNANLKKVGTNTFQGASNSTKFFGQAIFDAQQKVETLRAKILLLNAQGLKSSFGRQLTESLITAKAELKALEVQSGLSSAAVSGSFGKAFGGLRQIANILPGIGIAGIIGLAVTAVDKLSNGFFDAAFGADKFSKALDEASKSIDVDSIKVIGLVKALQSGSLTTEEFRKVKAQVIAQAPEFQKSFEGDRISIEASNAILTGYIDKLVKTVRVTASLQIVNETLAKSIRAVAKGEDISFGEKLGSSLRNIFSPVGAAAADAAEKSAKNVQKAIDSLKPESVSTLLEDTFKKLGITFKDFAEGVDDDGKALDAALAKQKAAFDKFVTETISKAKQFTKEFGSAFVVPDLEESFFRSKQDVFKDAKKLLDDIANNRLKIKIPTAVDFELLPEGIELTKRQIEAFFENAAVEVGIPVTVTPDLTLEKGSLAKIDKKLKLREQFAVLGDIGLKAFGKIDFTNINKGLAEGSKLLSNMTQLANTLSQSVGQGLANAFNSVFDALLQGQNVFKALGNALKALVVDTIKAVVQMLILKTITNAIFPGGGIGGVVKGVSGGSANLSFGSIGGSRSAPTLTTRISGTDLLFVLTQGQNTIGRSG